MTERARFDPARPYTIFPASGKWLTFLFGAIYNSDLPIADIPHLS